MQRAVCSEVEKSIKIYTCKEAQVTIPKPKAELLRGAWRSEVHQLAGHNATCSREFSAG